MSDVKDSTPPPGLRRPRFRLATLLLAVALIGAILAVGDRVGAYGAIWVVVFALAVIAHVAGNAMGIQLRANSSAGRRDDEHYPVHLPKVGDVVGADEFAPESRLRQRRSLGWLAIVVPIIGFLAAGSLGGYLLARDNWQESTILSVACGVLASGTLGAIGGFVVASFLKVMIESAWEATRHK